ncbi:MAG TPA: LysM domain-containing protein, partial [Pseudoxanthomonas sp.]|nr:LysM domain-containing protein [Pseudoxanthomonas sp.]
SPSTDAAPSPADEAGMRSHVVKRGESTWTIARRYGLTARQLQTRNHLEANSVLRPGMVLQVDGQATP